MNALEKGWSKYTPAMQNILNSREIVLEKEVLEEYTGKLMGVIYTTWTYKTNEGIECIMLEGWVDSLSDYDAPREVSCKSYPPNGVAAAIDKLRLTCHVELGSLLQRDS